MQTALHLHARDVAQAAAAEAVTAGTITRGTDDDARQAGQDYIDSAGDGILTDATVTVSRSPNTVTATITGHSLKVIPLLPTPTISQTVSGTIEQAPSGGTP